MKKDDLILKEIEIIQEQIGRFDNNGLAIKQWCLGVSTALIAYGVEKNKWLIVLASVFTTACFAFVELMYRRFQLRFISRSHDIEEGLKTHDFPDYEYKVHQTAMKPLGFWKEVSRVFKMPHFTVFYLVVALFGAACFFYVRGGNQTHEPEQQRVLITGTVTNISGK